MATKDKQNKPKKADSAAAKPRSLKAAGDGARSKKTARQAEPIDASESGPNKVDESADTAAVAKKTRGKAPVELGTALVEAFATHERINQYLLEHLEPSAWGAEAPIGKGRTIRGIVAHMHNVRLMWLAVAAEGLPAPSKVDRHTVTLDEARDALTQSSAALTELFHRALVGGGHVKDFKPDVVGFLSYLIAHESHHRGQVCLLARLLGHPLPQQVGFGMWEWRKRHAEAVPKE